MPRPGFLAPVMGQGVREGEPPREVPPLARPSGAKGDQTPGARLFRANLTAGRGPMARLSPGSTRPEAGQGQLPLRLVRPPTSSCRSGPQPPVPQSLQPVKAQCPARASKAPPAPPRCRPAGAEVVIDRGGGARPKKVQGSHPRGIRAGSLASRSAQALQIAAALLSTNNGAAGCSTSAALSDRRGLERRQAGAYAPSSPGGEKNRGSASRRRHFARPPTTRNLHARVSALRLVRGPCVSFRGSHDLRWHRTPPLRAPGPSAACAPCPIRRPQRNPAFRADSHARRLSQSARLLFAELRKKPNPMANRQFSGRANRPHTDHLRFVTPRSRHLAPKAATTRTDFLIYGNRARRLPSPRRGELPASASCVARKTVPCPLRARSVALTSPAPPKTESGHQWLR